MLNAEIFACSYCLMFFNSYFLVDSDGTVQLQQDGTFRSNCMDCLDRTNVIQSLLARRSLQSQLEVRWWWDLLSLLGSSSGQNTCTCRAGPHFEYQQYYYSVRKMIQSLNHWLTRSVQTADSFRKMIQPLNHWLTRFVQTADSFRKMIQSLTHSICSNSWFIPKDDSVTESLTHSICSNCWFIPNDDSIIDSLDPFKLLIHSEWWLSHWIIDSLDLFKLLIHSDINSYLLSCLSVEDRSSSCGAADWRTGGFWKNIQER